MTARITQDKTSEGMLSLAYFTVHLPGMLQTQSHVPPAEAERSGYGAIMVTVDSPRVGNREADERNK